MKIDAIWHRDYPQVNTLFQVGKQAVIDSNLKGWVVGEIRQENGRGLSASIPCYAIYDTEGTWRGNHFEHLMRSKPMGFLDLEIEELTDMIKEAREMAAPRGASGCCDVKITHEDNWKHRSVNMKCNTCMFYVPKFIPAGSDHSPTVGRCRRHSPTMNGFPVVYVNDWCGDHKLDEEKI